MHECRHEVTETQQFTVLPLEAKQEGYVSKRRQKGTLMGILIWTIPELGAFSKLYNLLSQQHCKAQKRNLLKITHLLSNGPSIRCGALQSILLLPATLPAWGKESSARHMMHCLRLSYLAPETGRNDQIQGQTRLSTA